MRVIGAGLPRTATTTQLIALEMLGLPCYHMRDMMSDLSTSVPQWRAALEGSGPWEEAAQAQPDSVHRDFDDLTALLDERNGDVATWRRLIQLLLK